MKNGLRFCGLAAIVLAFGIANAADLPADFYDKLKGACVEVLGDGHLDGSGWVAEADGVVVTAAHVVVNSGRHFEVMFADGKRLDAHFMAIDRAHDLALLRLPHKDGGYATLSLAENVPAAGRDIYLFGAPIYRHQVLLRGMMARNETTFEFYTWCSDYVEILHVNGNDPPGTSGGPWLNGSAEVVGLNSGMMRENGAPAGVAYLSPVLAIKKFLAEKHTPETATLGIAMEEIWQQPKDYIAKFPPPLEGIVILRPRADSPLIHAGLKERDLIVAADGTAVRLPEELLRLIRTKKPGEEVKLKVLRAGEPPKEVSVRLDNLEAMPESPAKKK